MQSPGYKILLDDISYGTASAAGSDEARVLMDRLHYKLRNDIEQMKLETRLPLNVVRCEGRRPRDPNDLTSTLVAALNDSGAVLELWGNVHASRREGNVVDHEAQINYALIPLRHYESDSLELPGVYVARYEKKAVTGADALVKLFGETGELNAYVAVSAGVRSLKDRKYDRAFQGLCRGELLLKQAKPAILPAYHEALVSHVRKLAVQLVGMAKQDSGYGGPLRLIPDAASQNPCPQ